jgi:hypothetical protein
MKPIGLIRQSGHCPTVLAPPRTERPPRRRCRCTSRPVARPRPSSPNRRAPSSGPPLSLAILPPPEEASRQARRRKAAALAGGGSCQRRRGLLAREALRRAPAQAGGRAGGAGQWRRLRPAEKAPRFVCGMIP